MKKKSIFINNKEQNEVPNIFTTLKKLILFWSIYIKKKEKIQGDNK